MIALLRWGVAEKNAGVRDGGEFVRGVRLEPRITKASEDVDIIVVGLLAEENFVRRFGVCVG